MVPDVDDEGPHAGNGRRATDRPNPEPQLELSYPCTWGYTVISEGESQLRAAVAGVVGDLEHTFEPSNRSSRGRYLSFRLEVVVRTDEERLRIFRELHEHAAVRYVL